MCQVGDIIVVKNYKSQGRVVKQHSFVVLNTEHGQIQGMDYDLVCNVMSSFKDEEQKAKKLSFPGNFPYEATDERVKNGHGLEGYIKAEQFYFFDRVKTDFYVIGNVSPALFAALTEFIKALSVEIEYITDNLE